MPPRLASIFFFVAVLSPACAKDIVLPSADETDTCGNGVVDANEDCDNGSPGCTECKVTPGWQCMDNTCFYPCGDGITGSGPTCEQSEKTTACDMTGWWISRENDAVRDAVSQNPQPASTWYLYRFSQSGGAFQVEQALHCGFHVTGNATVDCTPGSLKGLLYENDPSASGPHPRRGTFQTSGSGCTFSFDRFYRVRGGTTALLPADFSTHTALKDLTPLPFEADPLHPTGAHLDNQEDTDGDGFPGAAFQIGGFVPGIREATQRDFKEYATAADETVAQNAIQFTVHGDWDLQESVLSVQDCGENCQLIETPGYVDNATLVPRITLRYLGSTLSSPRVAAVVVRNPGEDIDADLETCANVRLALPHDPTL
ncbi:MAG TPA: hypothetical protein VGH28_15415 [Polyangiaceae bacterium]